MLMQTIALDPLRSLQLAAKLKHARRRLVAIELGVSNGVPYGPALRWKAADDCLAEARDTLRYLHSIEEELAAALEASREPAANED